MRWAESGEWIMRAEVIGAAEWDIGIRPRALCAPLHDDPAANMLALRATEGCSSPRDGL